MYRYVLHMYVCMYDVFSHVPVNIFKDIFSRRNCPVLWFSEITCDDLVLIFTVEHFRSCSKNKMYRYWNSELVWLSQLCLKTGLFSYVVSRWSGLLSVAVTSCCCYISVDILCGPDWAAGLDWDQVGHQAGALTHLSHPRVLLLLN